MSAPMCLKPKVAKDAAKRAVEVMNKEGQLKGLNIKKSGENYNNAIEAIARKASIFWRKNDEDENCFDDINSFVRYLEEGAQVAIPDSNYEVYMKVYNKLIKDTFIDDNDNEVPQPRIFYWEDPEEMKAVYIEEIEEVLEKLPENKTKGITAEDIFNDMILIEEEAADDDDEGPIKLVLTVKEPKKGGILTRQEAVLQRLIQLTEKVESAGYGKWKLDGKYIKTKAVTAITSSGDTVFPTIAGHIGTQVDKVARLFFDKSSILWEEDKNGEYKLKDENSLRTLIETHLGNMFTYKGLSNLLNDFIEVEKRIKESFGEDAIVFSTDYKMVALHENNKDNREWVIGSPDLLVIDSEGKVHVIDVKTNKINPSKGNYTNPYEGKEDTETRYRNQIYYYIGILRSWGFNVDSTPYILMADTFYESSDLTDFGKNLPRAKEGEVIGKKVTGEGTKDIFELTRGKSWDESNVKIKEGEQTLGAYAEQNPADILMTLGEEGNKEADRAVKLLYIEPRLHVEDPTAETRKIAGLIELENLDETEDEEIREQVSFIDQYESLTQEEKEIYNRFAGKPMRNRPLVGITKLADTDIFSNPNLIGSKEVEFLASRVMIEVNLWITKMQRGETIKAPNTGLIKNDKASSRNIPINNPEKTKGRSREKIIQYIGIDRLINAAFENIIGRRYTYGDIDKLTYKQVNIEDDDPEKDEKLKKEKELRRRRNDKVEFLRSHLTQFKIQGLRTLLSLESTVVPVIKRKSRTW